MKNFNGFVLLSVGLFIQNASASEVLGARQISESEISITVRTKYYCNDPKGKLTYISSGQFKFGPHFYRLEIVPTNRRLCQGEEKVDIVTSKPTNVTSGDVLALIGSDESVAFLKNNDKE